MRVLKVLVACEYSGKVRDAFLRRGHDAYSCDLLPTDSTYDAPGRHYQGNLEYALQMDWDLIIAHPPCTYLTNSGVRWLHTRENRFEDMRLGCEFFNQFKSRAPHVAIENPIPHKYARQIIGKYSQIIQPWQFGHGETKATCLWLENLPLLVPTDIVDGREHRIHKLPPSADRWKARSTTFDGIADAMAEQWGNYLLAQGV